MEETSKCSGHERPELFLFSPKSRTDLLKVLKAMADKGACLFTSYVVKAAVFKGGDIGEGKKREKEKKRNWEGEILIGRLACQGRAQRPAEH